MSNARLVLLASLLFTVVGCDEASTHEDDAELRAGTVTSGCSTWRCGYNAARINGESLTELHEGGAANPDGVKIVGFVSPLNLLGYKVSVVNDRFIAKGPLGTLQGAALLGSTILIRLGSGVVVPVVIAGSESLPSWADGAAPVIAYTLVYADLNNPTGKSNVCSGTLVDPLTSAVTLIGGETYDEATKTVQPGRAGWFTLACAGSAAAKLKLMNYSPSADFDGNGHPSTALQRQATLKMITADYCGDGVSFTATGTPLYWENAQGTVAPELGAELGDFEAAWGPGGALCLDAPRRPDLAAALHCAPPPCTAAHVDAGEWQTINPE